MDLGNPPLEIQNLTESKPATHSVPGARHGRRRPRLDDHVQHGPEELAGSRSVAHDVVLLDSAVYSSTVQYNTAQYSIV